MPEESLICDGWYNGQVSDFFFFFCICIPLSDLSMNSLVFKDFLILSSREIRNGQ